MFTLVRSSRGVISGYNSLNRNHVSGSSYSFGSFGPSTSQFECRLRATSSAEAEVSEAASSSASAEQPDEESNNASKNGAAAPKNGKTTTNASTTSSSSSSSASKKKGSSGGVTSGVRLEDVAIAFRSQQVLDGVTWEVKAGERVGLVGINGAGKTTQLSIIVGDLEPDRGSVIKARPDMKIAYLTQEFDVDPTRTVKEEFASAQKEQVEVLRKLEETQKQLEEVGDDMETMGTLLDELEVLNRRADALNVDRLDASIRKMMPELGFNETDAERLVASFSGGWQMRICLGKILLQEPDLLLLDEPTNHLDLEAIEWLEAYLKKQDVPMVIVSHDREFLDNLCTKVVATDRGKASTYQGNYSDMMRQRDAAIAQQWAKYERQQKEIKRQRDMIDRLSGGGQAGRASSAQKQLDKFLESEELVEKPFVEKDRFFRFPAMERSGKDVLNITNLTHGYPGAGRPLFDALNLEVTRGERVAFVGPNGAGKSTLLKLILGREEAQMPDGLDREVSDLGNITVGTHHIVWNYFFQNQAEALDLDLTVENTLVETTDGEKNLGELKALMGQLQFKGDAMHKKVKFLSGGEKARVALAKFMCTPATLLILDEPTNHLDIPSKEALEQALQAFDGTVICVSHDRFFLKKVATRIVEIKDSDVKDFEGDYTSYLSKDAKAAKRDTKREEKRVKAERDATKAKSKMSKAEKMKQKKEKAKSFNQGGGGKKKGSKNSGRWN